jgi:hypothetical protein
VTTVKTNRNKLFYKKFLYKVSLKYPAIRFVRGTKDLLHLKKKITSARSYGIVHVPKIPKDMWSTYKQFIGFCRKYKGTPDVGFHFDYDTLNCYSNSLDILQELIAIDSNLCVYEAVSSPPEIMYFSKEPKFAYRVYTKSVRVKEEVIKSLRSFRDNNAENNTIGFSPAFNQFIDHMPFRAFSFDRYLSHTYFIDYNDLSMLTYMHLMFDECIGKNYKLEKRPEKQ